MRYEKRRRASRLSKTQNAANLGRSKTNLIPPTDATTKGNMKNKILTTLALLVLMASQVAAQGIIGTDRPRTCSGVWPPPPSGEFCNPNRIHGRVDEQVRLGDSTIAEHSSWYRVFGWWENPPRSVFTPYLDPNGQPYAGPYLIKTVAPSDYNTYIYAVINARTGLTTYWRIIPGTPDDWPPLQ